MTTTSNLENIFPEGRLRARFQKSFRDHDYADGYARSFLNSSIATQIKVLREQRGLTQQALADLAKMKQPRIALLEDVNYSSWSISTLWRLARSFHLRLKVSFEEFGTLVSEVESIGRETLQRHSLEDDPLFDISPRVQAIATTTGSFQFITARVTGSSFPDQGDHTEQSPQFTNHMTTPTPSPDRRVS